MSPKSPLINLESRYVVKKQTLLGVSKSNKIMIKD